MAFEKLFEPIKIGSVTIKNRYAYAPTNFVFQSWDGMVNEQELAYYTARAMGGTGLIIYGAVLSTEFGVPYMQHPWVFCYERSHVQGLHNLAENIRLAGSVPIIQLLMVPSSRGQNWKYVQPVAPSPVFPDKDYTPPRHHLITERIPDSWAAHNAGGTSDSSEARALTLDEIQTIIKQNTFAATLATFAGWDGIELHLCHGYLVDSFRDPRQNRRKDRYGGSEENRNRLILELTEGTIRAAKKENHNTVVGVRVSCSGGEEGSGGFTFEETKRLALQLQEMGIDYYHTTFGQGQMKMEKGQANFPDGVFLEYSKELKKILKIPVITPSLHDPALAEKAVAEGQTDMVANGRPLFADPEYVNKVKENRVKDIVECNNCGLCQTRDAMGLSLPGRCEVNPELGFERYNPKYQFRQGFKKAAMIPHVLRK